MAVLLGVVIEDLDVESSNVLTFQDANFSFCRVWKMSLFLHSKGQLSPPESVRQTGLGSVWDSELLLPTWGNFPVCVVLFIIMQIFG
jgi:hypothetical protein